MFACVRWSSRPGSRALPIADQQFDPSHSTLIGATGSALVQTRSGSAPHPALVPTTTSYAPAASATTPLCANSATASSESCTGCLKTSTVYDDHTAWAHPRQDLQAAA